MTLSWHCLAVAAASPPLWTRRRVGDGGLCPADTLLGDFLLTYTVFMPTSQLCRALLHQYPSVAGVLGDWAPSDPTHTLPTLPGTRTLGAVPVTPVGPQGAARGAPTRSGSCARGTSPSSILSWAHACEVPACSPPPALVPLTGRSFRAEPLEGSEQEKATYSLHKRRKILRLVSQWVLLYGRLLQGDRSTTALLQVPGAGTAWGGWGGG